MNAGTRDNHNTYQMTNEQIIEAIKEHPLPWRYGGLIGDPGKPLSHCIKDANGKVAHVDEQEFWADYSGRDRFVKEIVHRANSIGTLPQDVADDIVANPEQFSISVDGKP